MRVAACTGERVLSKKELPLFLSFIYVIDERNANALHVSASVSKHEAHSSLGRLKIRK